MACRWFIGVSRAVKYLHSCRPTIVHRDLKPENVMLTDADASCSEAKVLDLGLHMRKAARLTLPGDVEGSWYGGNAYDAIKFNGSVYFGGRPGGARALFCYDFGMLGCKGVAGVSGGLRIHAATCADVVYVSSVRSDHAGMMPALWLRLPIWAPLSKASTVWPACSTQSMSSMPWQARLGLGNLY
jgi:serine/threonine protein kinase